MCVWQHVSSRLPCPNLPRRSIVSGCILWEAWEYYCPLMTVGVAVVKWRQLSGAGTSIVHWQQETANRHRRFDCWLSFTQWRRRLMYKAWTQRNGPNYVIIEHFTLLYVPCHWTEPPTTLVPHPLKAFGQCTPNTDMTYFDRWAANCDCLEV